MAEGLDIIVVDDDRDVLECLEQSLRQFCKWGEIFCFNDAIQAKIYCEHRQTNMALFILDVFMGSYNAFDFLNEIKVKFPLAAHDTVMITGMADQKVVDLCLESGVNHLLIKPLDYYSLQFSIRSIMAKYLWFANHLNSDPSFARLLEEAKRTACAV
ncbi:hypothetical protein AAU61_19380 [Desulfocarbo indianensis]|nr:hypothetical protein AAU61_19380 [Desulfocarbo indianensis]